jgi:hypothetical protein
MVVVLHSLALAGQSVCVRLRTAIPCGWPRHKEETVDRPRWNGTSETSPGYYSPE